MSKREIKSVISIGNNKINKIKKFAIIFFAVYFLLCIALVLLQDKIIFPRSKLSEEAIAVAAKKDNVDNIALKMHDGTEVRGWLVNNSKSEKSNLVIYFGANAEELSNLIPRVSKFDNWSIALINYRGYGASDGTPGEEELCSDSLDIYDYFANRNDINKNNIVIMGRSIGTGIATYLAEKRNTEAVILVSPFETLTSVVKEKCPILPINMLLKYRFDSISRAPEIKTPLLVIVGSKDLFVPKWHSEKLAKAWGGQVEFEEITGVGHNTVDDGDEYWNNIYQYLSKQ